MKIKWTLTENQNVLVRKIKNRFEDFLQIFGMWIVEEISEKSVKFRQHLVKFPHESARTLNNFDDVVWKIMKNDEKSQKFATKICWNIEVWAVQKHLNLQFDSQKICQHQKKSEKEAVIVAISG